MVRDAFGAFLREPHQMVVVFVEVSEERAQEGERLTVMYGQTRIFSLCRNSGRTLRLLDLLRNYWTLGLRFNSDRIQSGM